MRDDSSDCRILSWRLPPRICIQRNKHHPSSVYQARVQEHNTTCVQAGKGIGKNTQETTDAMQHDEACGWLWELFLHSVSWLVCQMACVMWTTVEHQLCTVQKSSVHTSMQAESRVENRCSANSFWHFNIFTFSTLFTFFLFKKKDRKKKKNWKKNLLFTFFEFFTFKTFFTFFTFFLFSLKNSFFSF